MTSDVISRKCDRTFDTLDADGNGVLEETDFIGLAEKIAPATGVADGSAKEEALPREWRRCWALLLEQADADGDGRISREEFHAAMSRAYGARASLERNLRSGFEAEFAAIDADDDGLATVEQMATFLVAWGLEPAKAMAAATRLDRDGDRMVALRDPARRREHRGGQGPGQIAHQVGAAGGDGGEGRRRLRLLAPHPFEGRDPAWRVRPRRDRAGAQPCVVGRVRGGGHRYIAAFLQGSCDVRCQGPHRFQRPGVAEGGRVPQHAIDVRVPAHHPQPQLRVEAGRVLGPQPPVQRVRVTSPA
ncbi:EF-hand domain-containing protein [Streptomyces sp. NPDC059835]|uniref:EF-hand domain-containing protein n=1 Tax=Streptomyces sp. NPDC059835 TaxID=3346967 RepID=UPI003653A198